MLIHFHLTIYKIRDPVDDFLKIFSIFIEQLFPPIYLSIFIRFNCVLLYLASFVLYLSLHFLSFVRYLWSLYILPITLCWVTPGKVLKFRSGCNLLGRYIKWYTCLVLSFCYTSRIRYVFFVSYFTLWVLDLSVISASSSLEGSRIISRGRHWMWIVVSLLRRELRKGILPLDQFEKWE